MVSMSLSMSSLVPKLLVVILMWSVGVCSGWRVVLKVAVGQSMSPGESLLDLWTSDGVLNDDPSGTAQVHDSYFAPDTPSYKSGIVNSWKKQRIQNVKVGMYDNGREVLSIVFNNSWSDDKISWFSKDNIIGQGQRYTDLKPEVITNCSAEGPTDLGRSFLIASNASLECLISSGWMVVIDTDSFGECHWEFGSVLPFFLYSQNVTEITMKTMDSASVFVIFVDDCVVNPCQYGGVCTNILGQTSCACADQYYGDNCQTVCPCHYGFCTVKPQGSAADSQNFVVDGQTITCNCTAGYTGVLCGESIDDCAPNPCLEGGVCIDGVQAFTCECHIGYYGTRCQEKDSGKDESSTGAIVAMSVVIPLVVIVIVLIVVYGIYIKRNPDGYGRATIYKHSAIARDFVRRSFRRVSGRTHRQKKATTSEETRDNSKIISSEQISVQYNVNAGFQEGDEDDGFGDGESSSRGYTRQDTEHIDLSPNDQAVISSGAERTKTPPSNQNNPAFLDARPNAYTPTRMYSASPRPDTEHSYPDSSQESNTSGSLYQEMNSSLTSNYGPAYRPDISPRYDDRSVQQKASSPSYQEPKRPDVTPHGNKGRSNSSSKPSDDQYNPNVQPIARSGDNYNQDIQPQPNKEYKPDNVRPSNDRYNRDIQARSNDHSKPDIQPRSNDSYNPDIQPRSNDRYNPDIQPRSNDRYNPDIQPRSNDRYNPNVQPRSDDRYNSPHPDVNPNARPTRLDLNPNPRDRYMGENTPTRRSESSPYADRHAPTRVNQPSPGYSPGPSPRYGGLYTSQPRTPSHESPTQPTVVLSDVDPVSEVAI